MKKIIFVAALAVLGFTSQAQVTFGAKAGANFANWTGDDAGETSTLTGFFGGVQVNIPFSSQFSVQPEALFSAEGAKVEGGKYAMTYVNVPVVLQFNSNGFFAETGPQLGLLVAAKAKPDDGEDEDIKELFKSTNFSWVIGLGYRLANGLGFGARYAIGLANIVDIEETDIKTSNFSVGLSFNFGGTNTADD